MFKVSFEDLILILIGVEIVNSIVLRSENKPLSGSSKCRRRIIAVILNCVTLLLRF